MAASHQDQLYNLGQAGDVAAYSQNFHFFTFNQQKKLSLSLQKFERQSEFWGRGVELVYTFPQISRR